MRGSRLTGPHGNNTFAYEKRKENDPEPQLRIPEFKTINSIEEITLGNDYVFCESDTTGSVQFFTGLEYIYLLENHSRPIYIFDNHNYALYFRVMQRKSSCGDKPYVIHIDQHSDLGPTPTNTLLPDFTSCTDQQCFDYAVKTCNVGNFINPALESGIIGSCNRIKNQYSLESRSGKDRCNLYPQQPQGSSQFRLDIDLDFWAPGMGTDLEKTIPLVRSLIREASLVTIATSPYFLNQSYAITLLEKLFYDEHQR